MSTRDRRVPEIPRPCEQSVEAHRFISVNNEPALPVVSPDDLLLARQSVSSDRAMRMANAVNTANTRLGVPICMSSLARKWIDQPRSIAGNTQSTAGATRRPLRIAKPEQQ